MDLYAENRAVTVPPLQTARLTLRPLVVDDCTAIAEALGNWEVTRWLSQAPFPYARDDAKAFIDMVRNDADAAHWAIDLGFRLIGVISVKPDLGYWLDQAQHGQGLMREAAHAVVDWYFTDHTAPLISGHFAGNAASRAILTGLGFTDTHTETITPVSSDAAVTLYRMALTHKRWHILRSAAQ
ncbi:GNAT family N-acetyltransferase [Yoonia sp.]|uniref:GNAT family N-acetyltransferase n=1 Tax=Yoonia sp. TaxID=2212373 RepID=UPI00391BD2FA